MIGSRLQHGLAFLACLAGLTLMFFMQPSSVFAAHSAGELCYSCHSLDEDEGEPGTAYINKTSRTLPRMKQYNIPVDTAPSNFGCTYCHNDNGRTTTMKPAITSFQGYTSFHPVGYNFVGKSESNNEYLSTLGSTTTQELDCVDCHDLVNQADGQDDKATTGVNEATDGNAATSRGGATGKYPEHGKPIDPVNNPYMLKSVTVAKEYDAFCRACHRSDTAQTIKNGTLQLTSHADNAPGRPLVENDGTVLRTADILDGNGVADVSGLATTAQCTYCHDTHYSMNRRLFNDGHEQHKTGGGMVDDTVVTSGDCTTLCHYAGDEKNSADGGNYYKHGHGMAQGTYKYKDGKPDATGNFVTMGYNCATCHVGIDPAQKPHADKYLSEPDVKIRYVKRFNLSGVMQSGDTGSAMGNPLVGICLSCHQGYMDHKTVSSGSVGCQDCHDEHAEGVGSTSNVMMIPEKAKKVGYFVTPAAKFAAKPGTETITYDSTKWDTATNPYVARSAANLDFFRQGDANGMCDSTECHAQAPITTAYSPLSGWIANPATTHSGGSQTAGSDCNACHAHNGDTLGGWRAKDSCDDCHAANGRTHAGSTKSQEMHDAHVASKYVTGCAMCHAHDGKTVQPLTGNHGVGGVVNFGGGSAKMTNAFDYADTFNTEANCSTAANGCHDADAAGEWAALSLGADACVDCHRSGVTKVLGTGTAPVSGLHNVTPTLTGQAHNEAITGGCAACHTVTALTTHKDGTLTGNGTVAGDRSNMGLGTLYTTSGADNSGTCAGTGASCHAGSTSLYRDDWAHVWDSTANYYTTATSACGGCHGDFANLWNSGSIHRTSATASSMHGGSGTFDCKDCHALEATTNSYTFGFGTTDWYPLNATSEHGNGSIEINSTNTSYNAASGLCTVCHTGADGVHNFADTTWPIVSIAGEGMSVACGSCHTAGVRPTGVSGAHALHLASQSALVDGGAACVDCHGNNGGSNYQMALSGTHGTGSVNFASVTYSATAQRGNVAGTCLTPSCHNRSTGTLQSTAWNSTQLDCDDCHFYAVSPTSALNTLSAANPRPISAVAHNDHFDNQKTCGQCHAVPVSGDTAHVNGTSTLFDKATAVQDEGGVAWTDTASVTDYTFNDTDNTCYSATNNGLGCHATGGSTGAADPTRPDWDTSFLSTNCTGYCHTDNTTAAVNPVSGLHGVTPTLTGTAHDEAITGGCAACHTVVALATHQNGAFTGNGSVAGDRSSMGLGTFYTTGGADNFGTCAGTGVACHANAPSLYRDDWRHEWNSTAGYYTTASSACGGCHGDFANAWNAGAIHRTSGTAQSMHGGSGTFDCKDCHALEATTNSYTFGFGTTDWYPLNATSEHGNGSIEINNNSTSYNAASGLCTACHTSADGLHNFADTTWPIVSIAGEGMSISCGACHTGGTTPSSASGAHTLHLGGTVELAAPGTACVECHGNNGGSNYQISLAGAHGTGSVNFANVTYSATAQRGNVSGTCVTTSCHNRSTGTLQSTAWNSTQLDCDDCHFYAVNPTSALNAGNPRPVSAVAHNDHFDNQKTCGQCHAVPAAGDTTHVNTSTTLADKATAVQDEGGVAWTDTAAVTDYTFNDTDNTCYSATNNGLGCHATGGSAGAADPTRPDWDQTFLSTNCTGYCHTDDTTAAVNPVSGLHGVTPTVTGQAHDESITTGCAACHTVTALATHQNGAFTGDGSVTGDRTSMGLGTFYTTSGSNNSGTCSGTGAACHAGSPSIYRDDWAHVWDSTAGYYTTASSACGGCHGDFANVWNSGSIHRTSATARNMHGGSGTFDCKDCHALEATTNSYTFGFGTTDWYPLNATSEHGNGSIEINSTSTGYNAASGLCTVCHTGADGVHNFADTSWPIASVAGEGMSVACGSCHTAGVTPSSASGAHTLHLASESALLDGGAACLDCHGNNSGANYQMALSGVHGTGSVNFASVTYSATASRGNVSGTCLTSACHNRSTGTLQSTAWNSTQLDCDDCHFYAVNPTSALNAANPRPVSPVAHNDHFDNQKVCGQCHAVPAAGDTAHVNGTSTLFDKATALVDEGGVAFTDTASVTDYTFNDTDNSCYSATNNGLGCHATGGSTGAADPTRPDWDASFVSTNCTGYCHTNHTTAAVNPVSGLHGVTPTLTGVAHDEAITGGCAACHTVIALATHQNGAFTGNGSVAGDRTSMGLGTFYTTGGGDNAGTCAGTGVACHANAPSLYRDDWRHEWNSTANYYTTASSACGGCHGDFANLWNAGSIHRTSATASNTHGGNGSFDCKDCHALEATTNNYTFGFGTTDWYPLNATSEHGNGSIEINNNGTSYNAASGLCTACHTSADGLHNFADTTWPIVAIAGEGMSVSCGSCHTGGTTPSSASGAHTLHLGGTVALAAPGTACVECHGNNGGANYQMSLSGAHGTGSVNFANVTYSASGNRGNVAGTCVTTSCHNRSTGTLQSTGWNSAQLDCDDCHFYAVSPTSALNNAHPRPVSAIAHNDHFDNQKTCGQCHAVPAAGDTTHVNTSTTLADRATALVDEGGVAFTDTASVTDYTFNDTDNSCYSATNNGLGCHATGGSTGAADPTRPDWDASFVSTNCTGYCHTNNTTAAVNPVSGLHGVTPTVTGQAHDESITTGCAACHTVTALATHQNGAFTGDGSVSGDRTSMGLGTFYTSSGSNNSGTCSGTGVACHANAPSLYRDDWRHEWNSTANYYTTATSACGGCHGDFANVWNSGSIHRTSAAARNTHGGTGTFDCKDCHALEATTNNYTFGFGTSDWFPLNASSEHGNGSIEINSTSTGYNAASGLCTVCHTGADGVHNFADTSWPIASVAGEGMSVACGSCHTAGVTPSSASGAHTLHLASESALLDGGAACLDCHGNNSGANYQMALSGVHGTGSVNFVNVTYSATGNRGNVSGTCLTSACHNRSTGTLQSTAWNSTQLDCDDCHFYAVSPTSALNNAHPRPVSAIAHNDHFDNQKTCGQCHAVPAAGDTTHVNTSTTLADRATALVDEGGVAFTDTASVTDYTFNDTDNSCYSATNNGLGCHATGGSTGAADPTRPDWDTSFLSTNCTGYCHTNHTTAAVNPVSGLHGVTPTVTGQAHDEAITGGCAACHTVVALATHQNGAFTGDGSVAGDRTSMGLGTFYTNTANNYGTCAGTGLACHANAPSLYRDDWRHEWNSTAGYYTTATTACGGCHGDFANVWNAGVIHRTSITAQGMHGGSGTFDCKDCHALEATTNNYTFGFGTTDWYPLNATSEHGNGSIEINSNSTSYNAASGLCTACHTSADGLHNFADTSWPIVAIAGEGMSVSCGSCHTGGTTPSSASGAHTLHLGGTVALVAPGTACVECHGNNGGTNYQISLAGVHGTGSVNFANVTYSATAQRGNVSGTCVTASCHNRSTGTLQSTAWNSTQLDCDDCHFYAVSPTSALNTANPRPVSAVAHNDHFDNQKVCGQCHAVPAAGDTAHVNGTTTLSDKATAVQDEGGVAWTDTAAVTDYTFNDTDNSCYSATNNGLGCHATGGSTGAADPTRPDWDQTFLSTNCTGYCHTDNTTAAVNPVSGLHGVTPTITGQTHDETITGGCAACHTVVALATHQNGAFTGDGSVSGDRTSMGLGTFYTTSGSNNSGTCAGTGASCHAGSPSIYRDDWAHVWNSTAGYYTTDTTACGGCHGDFANVWNAGVLHRTSAVAQNQHSGTGIFDCKDCHALEASANNYTFGFGTLDWYPLNATSEHGNGSIEINSSGTSYNETSGLCTGCHESSDGVHNFADTSWPIAGIVGDGLGGCETCHGPSGPGPNVYGDGTLPGGDGGTPKPYDNGTWGFNVNGHGSNGTATNTPRDTYGDPYLVGNAACTACHDTSDPSAGAGRHNNGVLNSVELSQNQSTNTAHLIAAFVAGAASPEYDVQVTFDDVCYAKAGCHIAAMSHRHVGSDLLPVPKASRFGDGGTILDGESIAYPVDSDLTTNASAGGEDFAVCISCHNPHGTITDYVSQDKGTNSMLRDTWVVPDTLCRECHR